MDRQEQMGVREPLVRMLQDLYLTQITTCLTGDGVAQVEEVVGAGVEELAGVPSMEQVAGAQVRDVSDVVVGQEVVEAVEAVEAAVGEPAGAEAMAGADHSAYLS